MTLKTKPEDFGHVLQDGEQWCIYTGGHCPALVVIHPERAPLMIFEDGGRVAVSDISPAPSFSMEPGEMSAGFGRRLRDPWG